MTRRSLILAKIAELLAGVGAPTGLTVHRSRTTPIDRDRLPAIVVYPVREEVETDDHTGHQFRITTVRLEHRVEVAGDQPSASATPPDDVLDPLLAWGTKALLTDPTLAGLAEDTEETGLVWAFEEADLVYGAVGQDFAVAHWNAPADQDTAP